MLYSRILLLSLLLCCISFNAKPQLFINTTKEDSKNIETIKHAISYLKSRPQPQKLDVPFTGFHPSWDIYDTLISKNYDLQYLKDSTKNFDTGFANLQFQKLLLYNIDLALDVIPLDSIVISAEEEQFIYSPGSSIQYWRSYSVCYQIEERCAVVTGLIFTGNRLMLSVSPFIDFNGINESIDLEGFKRRHGYDKIKHLIVDFNALAKPDIK